MHPESNKAITPPQNNQEPLETGSAGGFVIRARAILVGLIMAVLICAVTPFNNVFRQGTLLGGGHFPLAPFFILLVFTILLIGLGRLTGRRPFMNGKELLTAWIMTVMASGIAYTGLVRTFFVNLTAPFHFATVGNRWDEVLHPLLPQSWYPRSPDAVEALYNGLEGRPEHGLAGNPGPHSLAGLAGTASGLDRFHSALLFSHDLPGQPVEPAMDPE